MVLPALVERDDVAAIAVSAVLPFASRFRFDLGDDAAARLEGLLGRHVRLDRGLDLVGDVDDLHEDVQLLIDRLELLGQGLGVEAVLDEVVLLGGSLMSFCETGEPFGQADVVVGHDQAVGGDERAGAAAVEADGRFLQVLEPFLRRLEAVLFLEVFLGAGC